MKRMAVRGLLLGFLLGLVLVTSGAVPRRRGSAGGNGLYRSLGTFSEVLSLVEGNYVEPVESRKLFEGAFSGVTGALDPSCDYIPAEKLADFRRAIEKPGIGVGAVLGRRAGFASVTSVFPGGPAAEAKLRGGEILEAIDGRATRGLALWEAESALTGAEGSQVKITFLRPGKTKRENATLTRRPVSIPAPEVEEKEGVVVFRPYVVDARAAARLDETLAKGPAALVLDLRGTSGGEVEPAAAFAARLSGGTVAFACEVVRRGEAKSYRTPSWGGSVWKGPLAVLIGSGTSGSAELLAQFLVSTTRGKSVGENTAGVAGLRRLVPLPSGGALYLTVTRFRADGATEAIAGEGLEPQEEIWSSMEAEGEGKDPVLNRALDILLGAERAKKKAA
jgi:carboxyl-terminal processing protease